MGVRGHRGHISWPERAKKTTPSTNSQSRLAHTLDVTPPKTGRGGNLSKPSMGKRGGGGRRPRTQEMGGGSRGRDFLWGQIFCIFLRTTSD
jgi:hypothetical protein